MSRYKECIWNLCITGYYFLLDEVTLLLTHSMTVTVTLNEITVMCRHYRWCEVLHTQVFLQSLYRPGRPLGFSCGWSSQIARQSAHEGDQVVSPMHQPPLPQGDIPGTHFCYRLSQILAWRIMSMKTSNGNIRNRTRNLPVCSSVPQPTVPPPAPTNTHYSISLFHHAFWIIKFYSHQLMHFFIQLCISFLSYIKIT